ncbi:ATPase involved in chromosome partitioning [Sphaerochaeta pleomorpha str. Grapes]|uniref:ATPase involved in chromosome partitioning n=1 Tax=Sphaerochaeta pleomorpha (strain ATCC BAA-1885 / DSM 22778 / Grapes) TaxID=158190 RepID=G8QYH9_SPHPG|nr:ParA family protein [Sphaerochaeta pleomorpha]AEV28542.1 ATPase involved in chromosome partitioning [Sphaerochaeta pleomorpha str. Grapes]
MIKTVAFHLQKGGVGKTTISGTLACQSALAGFKTLLVDVDPQGNASSWFLKNATKYELVDVIQGKCFWNDAVVEIPQIPNLFLLPTFGIGGNLKNYSETKLAEEPFVIQDLIAELSGAYDRIILDMSPGLGRLERAALIASDEVITPMTPEVFSLDGLEIFIDELDKIKKNLRSNVKHTKIVINSFDNRIKQHRDIYSAACTGVFSVFKIPVDPLFRKAQEAGMAPQVFKKYGKGLKASTIESFTALDLAIWR